jgi:hypothetical protein
VRRTNTGLASILVFSEARYTNSLVRYDDGTTLDLAVV